MRPRWGDTAHRLAARRLHCLRICPETIEHDCAKRLKVTVDKEYGIPGVRCANYASTLHSVDNATQAVNHRAEVVGKLTSVS